MVFWVYKGGKAKNFCEYKIIIDSLNTAIIQESHIFLGHYIFEKVEDLLLKGLKFFLQLFEFDKQKNYMKSLIILIYNFIKKIRSKIINNLVKFFVKYKLYTLSKRFIYCYLKKNKRY